MRYENKEDYVRYQLQRNFTFGHKESLQCATVGHENRKVVGSFIHREEGFTEYDAACRDCLKLYEARLGVYFENAPTSDEGFYCEDCDTFTPYLIFNEDGSAKDGLLVHKDFEDRSETHCCESCYGRRKKEDQKLLDEEEAYNSRYD